MSLYPATRPTVEVVLFSCLQDNYGLLIRDMATGRVAAVDTPDAERIAYEVERRGWSLDIILNTHWHDDHVGGNMALKLQYGATIHGPEAERDRIGTLDAAVRAGEIIDLGETRIEVLATPGHTLGHVVYHIPAAGLIFVGDTLFAMGCGRLFEGTAEQMWGNMEMFAALPPDTTVYCAHEYTSGNGRFAAAMEPGNHAIAQRNAHVAAARDRGEPTVPFTIADECATNPFMRAGSSERLRELRLAKDDF